MNLFEQLGKQAAVSLVKQADTVKTVRKKPKPMTEWYWPEHAKNSLVSKEDAQKILDAMRANVKHRALEHTDVHLHGADLKKVKERILNNPKLWDIGKWHTNYNPMVDELANKPKDYMPDAFLPWSGDVFLPSGNPGILMHELGHAADFQEFPEDSYLRGFAGNMYRRHAPTLWKEHAAWRKGRRHLLEGGAKTDLDPALVTRTLRDAAQTKPVGLGSYWGSSLGAAGGGVGGLMAAKAIAEATRKYPIALPIAGTLFGGALGALGGLGIGKWLGSRESTHNEAAHDKYLNEYARAYSKVHGVPHQEALAKLKTKLTPSISSKPKAVAA